VQASAIIAQEDPSGAKRLLAYIVCDGRPSPRASELRTLVLNQLPDYMLPSTFIRVDELPITVHGKLDRNALPAPDGNNTLPEDEFVAPRTPLEDV